MSKLYQLFISSFFIVLLSYSSLTAQVFDGDWICAYATTDDGDNGTGIQTIAVAVISEDTFVGMVSQTHNDPWQIDDACYLVGYKNADSTHGRLGDYAYNTRFNQIWLNGFDQVFMDHARNLASRGNLIFVPNNDPDKNILVFEITDDSVLTHPMRMATIQNAFDPKNLWAIDIDDAGRVFVTVEGDSTKPSEIYIFDSPDNEPAWSGGHVAAPMQIITLPDNGDARGITVNGDGTVIYVSNYVTEKIYCYIGDPNTGYELYNGFDFTLIDEPVSSNEVALDPGPWGLQLMPDKNLLFVACANNYQLGDGYQYGRYYLLNPNTGEILDTIDCAKWNFDQTGGFSSRPGSTQGNVSGYTSPYNVDFDENNNVYTQSFYGWTVDKWIYTGTLPTIPLTITGIERDNSVIPTEFSISQNYPNPFNPATTFEFAITVRSAITLTIYSITGEIVERLINSTDFDAGVYKVSFDASKLASGTYLYSISDGKKTISKKMTLLK